MSEQKTLGMLFFSGPYQSEAAETVCNLANAALDKGYKVQIYCYMGAANSALENQKDIHGIFNAGKGFEKIVEKGAIVRVCNLCLQVRGTDKYMMKVPSERGGKLKKAGNADMLKIVQESDKFLVIC